VTDSFLSQRIGRSLVLRFQEIAQNENKNILCMTNNTKLQGMLASIGFMREDYSKYSDRQNKSPDVQMFLFKRIE